MSPQSGARIRELAIGTAGTATMMMAGQFLMARIAAGLATSLALLTLLLAMVGLYGVLATIVQRRAREVGLLGAAAGQIYTMVLRQGFKPVVQGLVLGLLLGSLARLALKGVINARVEVADPLAMVLVPLPPALAAFAACYLPARRAAWVNPNVALRQL